MKKFFIQTILIVIFSGIVLFGALQLINQTIGINLFPENQEAENIVLSENIDTKLEVETYNSKVETILSTATIRISTNKQIELLDSKRYQIVYEAEENNKFNYIIEILNLGVGENLRNIELKTKLSEQEYALLNKDQLEVNKSRISVTITRENYTLPFNMNTIQRFDNAEFIFNADALSAPVSKKSSVTTDYEPTDLVDLNLEKLLYTNAPGIKLRAEAAEALAIMLRQLKNDTGRDLVIASGFRSFNNQEKTYIGWVRQFGIEGADKISARPGFSEHQLGTAVDFFDADSGFEFTNNFDNTRAGIWLRENAHKYGFVQSYPNGGETETGYSHEAWHYRYVGIDLAQQFQTAGQTLNNFLSSKQ